MKVLSWVQLCDPMDSSLPGSYVHGIFQARILGWVAISFSRGSSRPRGSTQVSCTAGRLYFLSHQKVAIEGLPALDSWTCLTKNGSPRSIHVILEIVP